MILIVLLVINVDEAFLARLRVIKTKSNHAVEWARRNGKSDVSKSKES